jgi:hypothetical protein
MPLNAQKRSSDELEPGDRETPPSALTAPPPLSDLILPAHPKPDECD